MDCRTCLTGVEMDVGTLIEDPATEVGILVGTETGGDEVVIEAAKEEEEERHLTDTEDGTGGWT